jgi:hypothetical protein
VNALPDDDIVYLDSGAQKSVLKNANLLEDLHTSPRITYIEGVNASGESIKCTECGTFGNLGTIIFSPQASCNLLSISEIRNNCKDISYDFTSDSFLLTDVKNNNMNFEAINGLYGHRVANYVKDFSITSTKKDEETIQQIKEFQKRLGYVSFEQLAQIIRDGTLRFPFSSSDIYRAEKLLKCDPVFSRARISDRGSRSTQKFYTMKLELPSKRSKSTS